MTIITITPQAAVSDTIGFGCQSGHGLSPIVIKSIAAYARLTGVMGLLGG